MYIYKPRTIQYGPFDPPLFLFLSNIMYDIIYRQNICIYKFIYLSFSLSLSLVMTSIVKLIKAIAFACTGKDQVQTSVMFLNKMNSLSIDLSLYLSLSLSLPFTHTHTDPLSPQINQLLNAFTYIGLPILRLANRINPHFCTNYQKIQLPDVDNFLLTLIFVQSLLLEAQLLG